MATTKYAHKKQAMIDAVPDKGKENFRKTDESDVSVPLADYTVYMEYTKLERTLMGGTKAMRDAGETYLPQEENESNDSWTDRLNRSVLLNVFKRTIQKLTGEVFSKDIVLNDDVPAEVREWCENIDQEGNNLSRFCQDVFTDALAYGVSHVLVEYPRVETKEINGKKYFKNDEGDMVQLTQAAEKKMGWRPYWVPIEAKNVIGWRVEVRDGKPELTQLRVKEQKEENRGLYDVQPVEQIRVLEPGKFEIWELRQKDKNEKEKVWVMVDSGETSVDFIPLVSFFAGEKKSYMTAESPLDGLAWLNLMHWQSSSDQRNILHFARLITYFGKCLLQDDEGKIVIGANRMVQSNDPDGDFKIVEHSGKGIEAGRQDLKDLENQMALFGLTFMMPRTGNITATERSLDAAENTSALRSWALGHKDFIENCLDFTYRIAGKEEGKAGSVTVNTEFSRMLRDVSAQILLAGFEKGLLPRQVVFEEFKRRGLVKDEWDFLEVTKMIEKEEMERMPTAGVGGAILGAGEEEF